jgi:hypothetical protein
VKLVKQLLPALIAPVDPGGSAPAAPSMDAATPVADSTVSA